MARASPLAPLKLLTTNAVRGSLEELLPAFERQGKRKVEAFYYSTNQMMDLIKGGEMADVVILTGPALDELAKQGTVVNGSRTDLASTGIGVCVRKGAPRPDISTLDAFKRALLDARSIAHTTTGQSGVYFSGLIERLGIGAQVRAKARTQPGGIVGETVARGDAEIGIQQISEIYAAPGADLVGPFPPEIQKLTVFSAGIFSGTRQEDAARSLIEFLKTPASARVMKSKGLEPVKK
jgi:molybdate transport system substrate-binding protein